MWRKIILIIKFNFTTNSRGAQEIVNDILIPCNFQVPVPPVLRVRWSDVGADTWTRRYRAVS